MGQQPSMNQKKLCALCNVNAPNGNYKWCLSCYRQSKGGEKLPHRALCTKCTVNVPNAGYKWCLTCYKQYKQNGIQTMSAPPEEFPLQPLSPESANSVSSKKVRIDVWNTWIGAEVGVTKCPLCNLTDIQQGACNGWDCAHVVPKCAGGETTIDNLRPTCKGCNSSMAGKDLREFCKFYPGSLERLSLIENRHPRTKR